MSLYRSQERNLTRKAVRCTIGVYPCGAELVDLIVIKLNTIAINRYYTSLITYVITSTYACQLADLHDLRGSLFAFTCSIDLLLGLIIVQQTLLRHEHHPSPLDILPLCVWVDLI